MDQSSRCIAVAPRAGAWIETRRSTAKLPTSSCRPPCGGVDRNYLHALNLADGSAGRPPCGGVDRNKGEPAGFGTVSVSPPVRGRGSKHVRKAPSPCPRLVAPRAGAWIETLHLRHQAEQHVVAPRAGAWIETSWPGSTPRRPPCRPPCGGVDRNLCAGDNRAAETRRPSCGGRIETALLARSALWTVPSPVCHRALQTPSTSVEHGWRRGRGRLLTVFLRQALAQWPSISCSLVARWRHCTRNAMLKPDQAGEARTWHAGRRWIGDRLTSSALPLLRQALRNRNPSRQPNTAHRRRTASISLAATASM